MTKQSEINYNKSVYMVEPRPRVEKDRSRNTPEHELVKALVVWRLQKTGYEVYTEVPLTGGGVCDIFVPEIPAYVEILCSETNAMLIKKCAKYPKGLTQIVIRVKDILPCELDESIGEMIKNLKEALP